MEKEEIEKLKRFCEGATDLDPIGVANELLDRVPELLSALEAAQRNVEELKKILKDAPTHEDMDAVVFQVNALKSQLAELRGEVREWLCVGCNTVYPGPPQEGAACVQCPKCSGDCGPRGLMEKRALKVEAAELRGAVREYLSVYSEPPSQDETPFTLPDFLEEAKANKNWCERMRSAFEKLQRALARTEKEGGGV